MMIAKTNLSATYLFKSHFLKKRGEKESTCIKRLYACAWFSPFQNMAGVAKKRAWGRSRPTTDVLTTLLDNTEVEELISTTVREEKSSMHTTIDLQHPELISDDDLIKSLVQMKVPIHNHDSGEPSRERLIHLFKQHVIPRPQRDRHGTARKRKRTGDSQMDVEASYDWENSKLEPESRKRYVACVLLTHKLSSSPALFRKLDVAEIEVVLAKRQAPPTSMFTASGQQPMETTLSSTRRIHVVKLNQSGCGTNVTETITAGLCHKSTSPQIIHSVFKQEVNVMCTCTTIRLTHHAFSCVPPLRERKVLRPLKNNSESKWLPGLDIQSLQSVLVCFSV